MSNLETTLSNILDGRVSSKSGRTSDLLGKAKRVSGRASEVMVKVSGNTKGGGHVKAHLDYISRNGKLELENERGEILEGKEAVKELHKEWTEDGGKRRSNGKTRDTTNIVLSMPAGTEAQAVKESARDFAKKTFSKNHQYVFALHTDADHPHVHLTVKNLGYDGKRLHIKKGDPQAWRETFANELQKRGIDAEATARAPRGVIKKGISQTIKHIRERGLTPEVDKAKIKEIVEDFSNAQAGKPSKPKPWEEKIAARQTDVRKGWLQAAKQLHASEKEDDKALAKAIVGFVKDMPPMETERHQLTKSVAQQVRKPQIAEKIGNKDRRDNQNDGEER